MGTKESNYENIFSEFNEVKKLVKYHTEELQQVVKRMDVLLATTSNYHPILQVPVEELGLRVKVCNALLRSKIHTLHDIVNDEGKVRFIARLGPKGRAEVERFLIEKGYPLNTEK